MAEHPYTETDVEDLKASGHWPSDDDGTAKGDDGKGKVIS